MYPGMLKQICRKRLLTIGKAAFQTERESGWVSEQGKPPGTERIEGLMDKVIGHLRKKLAEATIEREHLSIWSKQHHCLSRGIKNCATLAMGLFEAMILGLHL